MWKLWTGVIADQIYTHLDQQNLLPEEQIGCRKGSRETNDLLCIDRAVIKEVKSRNKNLAMAWIDYNKAYDMIPHSWITECLDLFGVAENIKSLLVNSTVNTYMVNNYVQEILSLEKLKLSEVFSRRLFIPFSVCFSIDSNKFDFKKGEGSI